MTRSSPLRRSLGSSVSERAQRCSFLLDDRNTESCHLEALAAALAEHNRVREAAIRVYELHELQEEHLRALAEERMELERRTAEAEIAARRRKLEELKASKKPSPPPPSPAVKATPQAASASVPTLTLTASAPPATHASSEARKSAPAAPTATPEHGKAQQAAPSASQEDADPAQPAATQQKPAVPSRLSAPRATPPVEPSVGGAVGEGTQSQPSALEADRYLQIHQELKKLRKNLMAHAKQPGSPLKEKMGTSRREIRVAIGQLTGVVKGANIQPTNKILRILTEALQSTTTSPPFDVAPFVAQSRQPVDGADRNDAQLPALFLYLLNICAKGITNQFINECGANPKAADPIGVFTAQIFSHKDFQWRGQSLIDILMAKFRVVCPVLFGVRGNDRTERGRLAVGWRKDGPAWITEQNHADRMVGLGAGFASIALRDFSKSSKLNPYPPSQYWRAFARIVNCPAEQTSNTQFVVLKAMIDGYEQRFINFYGNAALAALRLALVDFPKRAPHHASAAGSLGTLADILRNGSGLILA